MKELKNYRELEAFIKQGKVVVDFYKTSCGPCKDFAPTYQKLCKEWSGKVVFGKLNLQTVSPEDEEGISNMHNLQEVPTFVLFRGGSEHSRVVGVDEPQLVNRLRDL